MYQQIKSMAEEALKLQNKNFMDETFKRIIAICEAMEPLKATEFGEAALKEFTDQTQKLVDAGVPIFPLRKAVRNERS